MYNLTCQIPSCVGIELNFLNEDDSWELFCKNAFGKEADRSAEIEVIGKKIVRSCKGLPLSIVVIGGLLSRSQQTLEHWEHVAENLNSIVNLENDEHCLQILYMSYNILPVHLKSCFLYMGVFPEDTEISVSELIKLWVVEGFIKPVDGKSLEEVAKECLYELIDRNLVLVEMVRLLGKIKSIKIHDLLLDLCLREAKKHKFLCLVRGTGDGIPRGIHTERRICTRRSVPTEALESASLARSLTWQFQEAIPASGLRLLRVYSTTDRSSDIDEVDSVEAVFRRVNLRYMYVNVGANVSGIPSSISLLWNLQTLIVNMSLFNEVTAPSEIWGMTQLRHVDCMALRLPDLPSSHTCVLASLHTLRIVLNLKCSQEVVRIIPNIKNLRITYDRFNLASVENLDRLSKLESLHLHLDDDGGLGLGLGNVNHLTFPHSLKKLSLTSNVVHWEDMRLTNIGSLPLLQVLKISLHGSKWETVEGEFCSLKVLLIRDCDLECWITDSTHFPRLENLILERLDELKEMPSSLGDISTLEFIWLEDCSTCAVDCVKRIQEEQEEFGNVFLHILVRPEQVIEDES